VSTFSDVTIDLPDQRLSATALDVSEGGLAIWGPKPAPRARMKITLALEDAKTSFEANGVVVREFDSDGGSVWGVAFLGLDDGAKERLKSYVRLHLTPRDA
jgi:hypothetical protein